LDDVAGAGRVLVEFPYDRLDLPPGWRWRQFALDGRDAHLRAVPVLACDVLLAAGVVPDQDRAEAGVTPFSFSAATRAVRSDLIAAAVALPSRIWAVMGPSSRMTGPRFQSGVPTTACRTCGIYAICGIPWTRERHLQNDGRTVPRAVPGERSASARPTYPVRPAPPAPPVRLFLRSVPRASPHSFEADGGKTP